MVRKRLESVATDASAPTEDAIPSNPAPEPTPAEYEVRRQALLAKLPPKEDRPTTLVGKLALITSLVGEVQKTGTNKFHDYKYAKESDLVEAIRPLMAELGVWLHSTLSWDEPRMANVAGDDTHPYTLAISPRWVGHERVKVNDHAEIASLTILMIAFHFVDGESGEVTPVQIFPGYGDDVGDKGAYKALTGATKYFLMKTFLVSTGDDPEGDSRADERAAARDASTKVTVSRAAGDPAAHGGRQKTASKPQIRALGEVLRAAGVATQEQAIEVLQKLTGKSIANEEGADLNVVITEFISSLTADEIGKAIQDVKAWPTAERDNSSQGSGEDAAGDAKQAEVEAPEEAIEDAIGEPEATTEV